MLVHKEFRRRALALAALAATATAIEWEDTTSSTSYEEPYTAAVAEMITIVIPPGERASIVFSGAAANHTAVSYRQCSSAAPQPVQIEYATKLHYEPRVGGCIYAENELAEVGEKGCTFWQYNPSETWQADGIVHENTDLVSPGRVRFENQGRENATLDVVMFTDASPDTTVPNALADASIWIEDGFTKKDNIINTSVNVYFNVDGHYCDVYGCSVSGWVNDYEEGRESLSLCEVQENGVKYYEDEPFDTWIPLSFELPEDDDYFVTLILSARPHRFGGANLTEMQEYGLDEIVVFQTDTTQADSSAQLLAGLSLVTLSWLILVNTLFATFGSESVQHGQHAVSPLGW